VAENLNFLWESNSSSGAKDWLSQNAASLAANFAKIPLLGVKMAKKIKPIASDPDSSVIDKVIAVQCPTSNKRISSESFKSGAGSWKSFVSDDYYIDKWIPASGRYTTIGKAGSGKSTLLLHIGIHMAAGMDWLGYKTKHAKVLWLNCNDEPKSATGTRLVKMLNSLEMEKPDDLTLIHQSDFEYTFGLRTREERENMHSLIEEFTPDIIFIDSLRKILPFDNQVMLVNPLRDLYEQFPNMVLFPLHHAQEKGISSSELFTTDDPGSYMANSSELARDMDGYFVITSHLKNELIDYFGIRAVTKRCILINDLIRIDVIQDGKNTLGLKHGGTFLAPLRLEERHIIDILHEAGNEPLTVNGIRKGSHSAISQATIYRYIEELFKANWIETAKRGDRGRYFYRLTAKALEKIAKGEIEKMA
jgi:DNA-binding MarR family transcriptional regulator